MAVDGDDFPKLQELLREFWAQNPKNWDGYITERSNHIFKYKEGCSATDVVADLTKLNIAC